MTILPQTFDNRAINAFISQEVHAALSGTG